MDSKLSSEWLRALCVGWIKFFGPMAILASDQEGAITSDQVGIACEKFGIKLDLGGSYGHTAAPVAERRLALIKLCAVLRRNLASQSHRTCVWKRPAWLLI